MRTNVPLLKLVKEITQIKINQKLASNNLKIFKHREENLSSLMVTTVRTNTYLWDKIDTLIYNHWTTCSGYLILLKAFLNMRSMWTVVPPRWINMSKFRWDHLTMTRLFRALKAIRPSSLASLSFLSPDRERRPVLASQPLKSLQKDLSAPSFPANKEWQASPRLISPA